MQPPVYQACFAAGTLVHTHQGPLPIEQVRVGTQVLSQPENGGATAYKRVINTVAHLDQPVHAVQVKVQGRDQLTTLITTPNHPFWVQTPLAHGQHWLAAEHLEPGMVLQIAGAGADDHAGDHADSHADGTANDTSTPRYATVHANGLIRHTQHAHIGFAADDRAGGGLGVGIVLDLTDPKHVHLVKPEQASELGSLQLGQPFLTPVYNFEVEDFHTYYVGDAAVWVHNTNCPKETALATVAEKIVLLDKGQVEGSQFCFAAGTLVHTKNGLVPIEQINVGDWVLSRNDNNTGKQAYKRVLKTIQSDETKPIIMLRYYSELDEKICQLYVTNEHPIFVKSQSGRDIGWEAAHTIAHPDKLVSFDGTPIEAFEKCTLWATPNHGVAWGQSRVHDYGPLVDFNGSAPTILEGRTSEEAMGGMSATFETIVYNLEVEDFHTYYVGELGIWVHNTSSGSGDVGLINSPTLKQTEAHGQIYSRYGSSNLPHPDTYK